MTTHPGEPYQRRSLLRGLVLVSVGTPSKMLLAFLAQLAIARLLRPAEFGSYALASALFATAALVVQLGLPVSVLRRTAAALSSGNRAQARSETLMALGVALLAGTVAGLVIASPLGAELLGSAFPATAVASVAGLIGLNCALRVMENVIPEVFRAFRRFGAATAFGGLLFNALFLLVLGVWVSGDELKSLSQVLFASAGCSVVGLLGALFVLSRLLARETAGRGQWLQPVQPAIWLATIEVALITQLDLVLVGALGSARDVALYNAPFRLALMAGLPLLVINQVVSPLIPGKSRSQPARASLERLLRSTAMAATTVAGAIAAASIVFGGVALRLAFGSFYAEGKSILVVLVLGQFLQTATGSCGIVLLLTGHERVNAQILGVSTAMTAILDVLGFELFGVLGIAIGTTIGLVVQNVAQLLAVQRLTGLSTLASPKLLVAEVKRSLGKKGSLVRASAQ